MLTNTTKWSHAAGNHVVPSRWQATSRPPAIAAADPTSSTPAVARPRGPAARPASNDGQPDVPESRGGAAWNRPRLFPSGSR